MKAKTTNLELADKYKTSTNWYNDFNELIFGSLSESDACLFLAATAFASATTAIDVNILEAAKLFSAVKTDFKRGNAGIEALKFIANNIKNIDKQHYIDILSKLSNANSSYARLLAPKHDPNFIKKRKGQYAQVKEITVSGAKMKSYNKFVLYYIENGGKLTKQQVMADMKNGKIEVGGTKIYSFFVNLIDPEFEWKSVDGIKIQPATVDRWMIKIFFEKPIKNLMTELQEDGIVEAGKEIFNKLSAKALMDVFRSDKTRATIIKILNDKSVQYGLKAQELQAFTWVKFREESGIKIGRAHV